MSYQIFRKWKAAGDWIVREMGLSAPEGELSAVRSPQFSGAYRGSIRNSKGSSLVTTLLVITVLTVIVVAFMQSMSIERMTARSYADIERAKLAADAGAEMAKQQIASFLVRDTVGGISYTAWSYFPSTNSTNLSYTALTSGRPPSLQATNYISEENTAWLFSPANDGLSPADRDPDSIEDLLPDQKTDLAAFFARPPLDGELPVPWFELSRVTNGGIIHVHRFAYWSEDDSSRINIAANIANEHFSTGPTQPRRKNGALSGEIIPNELINDQDLQSIFTSKEYLFTDQSVSQVVGEEGKSKVDELGTIVTTHSRAHNRIRFGPVHPAGVGGSKRGMRKLNLNWTALTNLAIPAQQRVNYIADALEQGVPDFYSEEHVGYYQNSTPVGGDPDLPAPASIRREMRESLAASIIDYLDSDNVPTQPDNLPNLLDTESLPSPVRFIADIPRPRFFGAEAAPVLNEIVTIWNAGPGENQARSNVSRTGDAIAGFTYSIPITWKFELWNMSDQTIPARHYSIRGTHVRQIVASAFGFGGDSMPPDSEVVFPLGSLAFDPGEIKVVEYSETFESTGPNDLGTTWNSFRLGPDGKGGLGSGSSAADNADDQPERHARSSFVLLDSNSGKWISNTNYLDSTNVGSDGVAALGPGNMGASKGNRINDPRSQPQRVFALNTALTSEVSVNSADSDRDWQEQSPGSLGSINNAVTGRFYQHLGFWFDRPRLVASNNGSNALANVVISSIANTPMASIGELGNIYDPAWHNPINRGSDSNAANTIPYRATMRPPFRGGASLRVGQPDGNDSYGENSWAISDVLTVDWKTEQGSLVPLEEQFGLDVLEGLVNVNMPKYADIAPGISSNLAAVFRLPNLDGVTSGAGTNFNPDRIVESIKTRLTRNPPGVNSWRDARPFYLPAEISELAVWQTPDLYSPVETLVSHPTSNAKAPSRLNRSDYAREEIAQKAISRLTTGGSTFRIYVVGQFLTAPLANPGEMTLKSRFAMEQVVDFECTFNEANGVLIDVSPKTIQLNYD